MRLVVVAMLGIVLGFGLSRALVPAPALTTAPLDAPRGGAPLAVCRATISAEDVEKLTSAVAAAAASGRGAAAEDVAAKPAPVPSPEAIRATQQAVELIDRALVSGAWTDENAAELRTLLPLLSPDDQAATLSSLMTALNSQRMALRAQRPI
jgi:hypothetical protein